MQACTETNYHEYRKEQLSLRTGSAAFVEAKDASTYTKGASLMMPELAHRGRSGPALAPNHGKGASSDTGLAQNNDHASATTVSNPVPGSHHLPMVAGVLPTYHEQFVVFAN